MLQTPSLRSALEVIVECGNASVLTCGRYRGDFEGICLVSYFIRRALNRWEQRYLIPYPRDLWW